MKKLFLLFAVIALLASCRKAGTGGEAEIQAMTMHHSTHVNDATVYLKFNAEDFPGENIADYDLSAEVGADGHAHFSGLKRGKYFLYGVGFDSTINESVSGGVAVEIKKKDEIKIVTVPVTEGH